jgi:fermentation-respiration switch protein FrsA (DUF1100 family)
MTNDLPYVEYACTLALPGWEIPAALTLPASFEGGALPSAILLIPGSLFSDVNGDYPSWNSFPHTAAHLARQLAERGHAVYRYAKLGPGTGSVRVEASDGIPLTWEGRLTIAIGALDAMRRELDARGIAVERVIGAGHSEGAVVVSRVALTEQGATLDGVVLLAGPSVGILEIMREQAAMGVPPELVDDARRRLDQAIGYIRRGELVPAEIGAGSSFSAGALAAMPEGAQRYMRDVDATDPLALVRAMHQPTLIVQGGGDTSVPTHHGEALSDARGAGGEYLFVPELSHMFKLLPPGLDGAAAFGYPGPTDVRITDGIDAWIRSVAPTPTGR